jgi:hypothetical protein
VYGDIHIFGISVRITQGKSCGTSTVEVEAVFGAEFLEDMGQFGFGYASASVTPAVYCKKVKVLAKDGCGAARVTGRIVLGKNPFCKAAVFQDYVEAAYGVFDFVNIDGFVDDL